MKEISVSGFRCFNEEQQVPLTPLTLLVGKNSTGKSSFLALIRALWDVALKEQVPDFKEAPYDLGAFKEIIHFRGKRGGKTDAFEAGFAINSPSLLKESPGDHTLRFNFVFQRDGAGVMPSTRCIRAGNVWVKSEILEDGMTSVAAGIADKKRLLNGHNPAVSLEGDPRQAQLPNWYHERELPPLYSLIRLLLRKLEHEPNSGPEYSGKNNLRALLEYIRAFLFQHRILPMVRPFSNAPVRSKPWRTYDPAQAAPDPEGAYVPMLLADIYHSGNSEWGRMKKSLEAFGRSAGLFDEIAIKAFDSKNEGPFQLRVRQLGTRSKGPYRNIVDVGFGVSQVLPVVTELLRSQHPRMFLLQQPELHLHPSAQAALGSLFCNLASQKDGAAQLIVETHSDALIERIRIEVRDGTTHLKPQDVSILFFERQNLSVKIHPLGWDQNGNLIAKQGGIPHSYREFFRIEGQRTLGL